jgi:hypothetical protein
VVDRFGLVILNILARADFDPTRLHRLGQLPHKVDLEESVFERRFLHFDKVGEAKTTFEVTRGDTTMDVLLVGFFRFAAGDEERVLRGAVRGRRTRCAC